MRLALTAAAFLLIAGQSMAQQFQTYPTGSQLVVTYDNHQSAPVAIQTAPAPLAPVAECKTTVCVTEPKKNTKTVYTSVCKEYCVPHCTLFGFGSDCGCDNCEKRTKNVLVKKKVPTCDTTQCVLKEVPASQGCVPCNK